MKFSTLEYFVALAETKSINKTAQYMHVAQPSLSKALQNFEKEIGVQLFYRGSKGIELTKAGKTVLAESREILRYYNGWKELPNSDSLPQIDIYTQSIFSFLLLPDIIMGFSKAYPNTRINLQSVLRPETYISRNAYQPVLVLFVCKEERLKDIAELQENEPVILLDGEYQCLMNVSSPFSGKKEVSFEELKEMHFVTTRVRESEISDWDWEGALFVRKLFKLIPRRNILEVETIANVFALLRNNENLFTNACYPIVNLMDEVKQKKIIHIPYREDYAEVKLCLSYSRQAYNNYPEVRELVKSIKAAVRLV